MSAPARTQPLTLAQNNTRFALFSNPKENVHYDLFIKLQKGENYSGHVTVTFDLEKPSADLFIDFAGKDINAITLNGTLVETSDKYESLRKDRFVSLPEANQKAGRNTLVIDFANPYTKDGEGLHSFVDTDGKQYLYSQGEVYNMNKVFPCFDQPDLKAVLRLTLAGPNDWVLVHNTHPDEEATKALDTSKFLTEEEKATHRVVVFKATERVSSYLYAICAGNYESIACEKTYKDIPSTCYCRASLFNFLKEQAAEIFEYSNKTIEVFENFFGHPFPFPKNDHVFCPEFNYGAMENPGCITYTDNFLFRAPATKDKKAQRANVISHELAHFWFGDLVTMKWWNDIWLNESFADFISHWCMSKYQNDLKASSISEAWLVFNTRKGWGYREDQQKTTHPIVLEVNDTVRAFTIFDGITYAKGAAVLKQLMSLIGEENFGKALQHYFKKFAWTNATLNDFIDSLQNFYKPSNPNFPSDLKSWQAEWLEKAGLNEVEPVWDVNNTSDKAELVVRQTAALAEFPTLRHHKMKIAFFDENANIYHSDNIVLKNTETTTITYDGTKKPRAVFLNYQDESFVKVIIDLNSLEFFKNNLTKISDELAKSMIWRSLFDMVRDGKLSAYQFAVSAAEALPNETSEDIIKNLLLFSEAAAFQFSPKVLRNNYILPILFNAIHEALIKTDKSKTDKVLILVENLIKTASVGDRVEFDNISKLADWFDGRDAQLKPFELSNRNRWDIVIKLHAHPKLSDTKKRGYFLKCADIDSSDEAKKVETRCEAMLAEGQQRKNLFKSYFDPENKASLHQLSDSWQGFKGSLHYSHDDEKAYFETAADLLKLGKHPMFLRNYFMIMNPSGDNLAYYEEQYRVLNEKAKELNDSGFSKSMGENLDDVLRRKKAFLACAPDLLNLSFGIKL